MNPLKSRFPALVLVLAAAAPAVLHAQPEAARKEPTRIQGGLGVLAGVPLGEFGNIETAGGVSGHFAVVLGDSVVSVGVEAAGLIYGSESRKVPLSSAIPDLPGVVVTVNTDNEMILVHGRVRAQPRRGRWRPYIDGLFGFTRIYTTTSIEEADCDAFSCTSGISAMNQGDFVPSFGGGAGVMVGFGSPPHLAKLDVSVRYLRGGEADYLTEGAIRREGGQAFADISRSRTDMVLVYIGVAFGR